MTDAPAPFWHFTLAEDHLPQSVGSTFPDAAQSALECRGASLTHVQHGVHQDPTSAKFLSTQVPPQPVLVHGVVPTQGQNLAFPFAELHEVTFFFFLPGRAGPGDP